MAQAPERDRSRNARGPGTSARAADCPKPATRERSERKWPASFGGAPGWTTSGTRAPHNSLWAPSTLPGRRARRVRPAAHGNAPPGEAYGERMRIVSSCFDSAAASGGRYAQHERSLGMHALVRAHRPGSMRMPLGMMTMPLSLTWNWRRSFSRS